MAERILRKALRLPIRSYRRHRAKTPLTQLILHDNPRVRAVACALLESLSNTTSAQEQELICSIEERRSSLLRSAEEITVIDYGAGKPGSDRTKEEMEKGVKSTSLVGNICRGSKPAFWATILFKLIRKLQPLSCVELGACVGISGSYQAAALSINGKGRLVTLEGSPEISRIARETLKCLNLPNASVVTGRFHEILKGVLASSKPVDFFFNDGHHDHDAVIEYFTEALPFLSNEAVMVVDDISWSPGMRKAWTEIEDDTRVAVSIDLRAIGVALVCRSAAVKERFRIPL